MNKKTLISVIVVGLLLVGGIIYLSITLSNQKKENKAMQELAELGQEGNGKRISAVRQSI